MNDLQNPTPASATTANPAMPEPAAAPGTVQPSGQVGGGQSAPAEESFTKLDVNTLPPQLRQAYDNMLRDYKDKTTKLSEERKKTEGFDAYKQKAELYEQIAAQDEFVRQWNEYVQRQNAADGQKPPTDPTVELKAQIEEIQRKQQQTELAEVVEAFAGATDEKGQALHPEFDALNSIDLGKAPDGQSFSLLRACIELSPGNTPQEKLTAGYKTAKAIREQIFEEGRKSGMGKMLAKVRNSTEAPTITSDKQAFNGDPKKLSVREARELAEKGVLVH